MSGSLVDTNVVIKVLNGNDAAVKLFDSLDEVYISAITVGELIYGAWKSSRKNENIMLFESFLSEYPLIAVSDDISRIYGEIKAELVFKGINIPENDLWIAATAIFNNYSLVTFDQHFRSISKLRLVGVDFF
jgi:tRNA(fMet)-specific endonuclease VapC